MFGIFGSSKVRDLKPSEVHQALKDEKIILVDVREPGEFASERISGSVHHPLSSFDPKALPATNGRTIVMQCGSGIRSAKAVAQCQKAGMDVDSHLAGGIMAWKGAGLPTVSGPVKGKR